MVTKEELLELRSRILPSGAVPIVELLTRHHTQLEISGIVLENVPLLIIGRHGMIARLPIEGKITKVSNAAEIYRHLETFLHEKNKLYIFINLPKIHFPDEVSNVISEVNEFVRQKEDLYQKVDQALDAGDKEKFKSLVKQLKILDEPLQTE